MKDTATLNNVVWRRYKIFYISQSTAFITPILYIFLQDKLSFSIEEILRISSYYWLASIALQLPCGVIADRWGVKNNLFLSLVLQIFSCVSFLSINNKASYHIYLICICLAQALSINGASIFLKGQLHEFDSLKFKEHMFRLQNSFYKLTSVVIVISSVLYTINTNIPLILQIVNFLVSAYFLNLIPEQYISVKKSSENIFKCSINDLKKSLKFLLKDNFYLFIVICNILFGLGVSINQKTIQSQLVSLFANNKIIFMGSVIALGNLFSSSGAQLFYQLVSKRFSTPVEIFVLGGLMTLSYILMAFDQLIFVILGFMLVNLFKGCYRPLLSVELINHYPFNSSSNTNSAVVYSFGIILASIIQYIIAYYYFSIEIGNMMFAILSMTIIGIGYLFSKKSSNWSIHEKPNLLTRKSGIIEKANGQIYYIQLYPSETSDEHLQQILVAMQATNYPTKSAQYYSTDLGEKGLKTVFLGETHLSDVLDPDKQFKICAQLLQTPCHISHSFSSAKISQESVIFRSHMLKTIEKEPILNTRCLIHGDLHPQNIMVFNGSPYVIDWDLCGNGPFWYDLFSLLSHPYLYLSKQQRYQLFSKYSRDIDFKTFELLFHSFCRFKGEQLKQLAEIDQKLEKLSNLYLEHATRNYSGRAHHNS